MDPVFRQWLIDFGSSGYIAWYRFDGDTTTILAVRHQKEVGYEDQKQSGLSSFFKTRHFKWQAYSLQSNRQPVFLLI
jgi:hypothetical protein